MPHIIKGGSSLVIQVNIPGRDTMNLEILVLDFNGTVALDGEMLESVKHSIFRLSSFLKIHILTSDTYGTVERQCEKLPVQVRVLESKLLCLLMWSFIT